MDKAGKMNNPFFNRIMWTSSFVVHFSASKKPSISPTFSGRDPFCSEGNYRTTGTPEISEIVESRK